MKINVNTANTKELCELEGVGPALAKRIMSYRRKKKFTKGKDLLNVKGISEDMLKDWRYKIAYSTSGKTKTKKKTKTTPKRKIHKKEPTLQEFALDLIDDLASNFIRDKFEDLEDFLQKRKTPKKKDLKKVVRQQKDFIHRDHTRNQFKTKIQKRVKTNAKILTFNQINNFAKELNIDPAAMRAVIEVESSGGGFLPDGRPKILFEGHIFWSLIEAKGLRPRKLCKGNEDILYPRWTKKHYKGGAAEHDRLERAKRIHENAALSSASWGMFQIMGFNYYVTDYRNVSDFVAAQYESELEHLKAFIGFVKTNRLLEHLRTRNWAKFAAGYNGKSYRKNKYDERLETAYHKFKYQP